MLDSAENKGIGMDPLKRAAETVGVMDPRIGCESPTLQVSPIRDILNDGLGFGISSSMSLLDSNI
jgi:hypothetical protein